MSEAYIIEVDDIAAGIVERERHGFRFRAAHRDFFRLERRHFATPWRCQRAAEDLLRELAARRARQNRTPAAQVRQSPATAAGSGWGLVAHAGTQRSAIRHLAMPR